MLTVLDSSERRFDFDDLFECIIAGAFGHPGAMSGALAEDPEREAGVSDRSIHHLR